MSETGLTLWQIEETIAQLLELSDDADARHLAEKELPRIAEIEEEQKAIEAELARYIGEQLVAKVDGYIGIIRRDEAVAEAAEKEAERLTKIAKGRRNRIERLKQWALESMQAHGQKRLEGTAGRALRVQPNGGAQPVVITEPSLVPAQFQQITVSMPIDQWIRVDLSSLTSNQIWRISTGAIHGTRLKDIAAELQKPCPHCDHGEALGEKCPECNGTGKRSVPGAHLGERGVHLRVE